MLATIYHYAKAYYAALATGVLYLTTVIGPDIQFSDLAHVSLLHWFGFVGSVLGVSAGVAVITNGDKPGASAPSAGAGTVINYSAPATAYPVADVAAPEVSAPEVSAPEVTAPATPAQ